MPATVPAAVGDRRARFTPFANSHTTSSPTITSIAGQMKL